MLCIQLYYRHVYSSGISQGHRLCSQDVKGPRDPCIDRDKMIETVYWYVTCYKEAFIIGLIVGLALRIKYVSVK